MPIILATQEAEIRMMVFQNQAEQIVHETLSRIYSTRKRAGRVVQLVKCLPSKHEALNSKPILLKNKQTKPLSAFATLDSILSMEPAGHCSKHPFSQGMLFTSLGKASPQLVHTRCL
jgi:hypothetical protein